MVSLLYYCRNQWDVEDDGSGNPTSPTGRLTQAHGQYFSFMLQLDSAEVQGGSKKGSGAGGDKDVILRVDGVDTLIKWMNAIGAVCCMQPVRNNCTHQ